MSGSMLSWLCFLLVLGIMVSGTIISASSVTFTFKNNCHDTVYPGVLSNVGMPPLHPTGFALEKGESKILTAPSSNWGGQIWARTHCSNNFDDDGNHFKCDTGDCGSGKVECFGAGPTPPTTLVQFTIDDKDVGMVYFDVSLVKGYNLPIWVAPSGRNNNNCMSAGCPEDLNHICSAELKIMNSARETVACKNSCGALIGSSDYCLKPSHYSKLFKDACPQATGTYAGDQTTTVSCTADHYNVTFCPTSNKSKGDQHQTPTPNINTGNSKNDKGSNKSRVIIASVVSCIVLFIAASALLKCYCNNNKLVANNVANGSCNNCIRCC